MIDFPVLSHASQLRHVAERFSAEPELAECLSKLDETALLAALISLIPKCDEVTLVREIALAQNTCLHEWQTLTAL